MANTPRTVLVVDDDTDTCANLFDLLSDVGFRVDVADGGVSALEQAQRQPYDVALLDLRMPGMDGLALCRQLKRLHPAMLAMLITGFATPSLGEEARAAGVRQVLCKPIAFPELLSLVEEGLQLSN
jgi:CheY-like chemotaxis protein